MFCSRGAEERVVLVYVLLKCEACEIICESDSQMAIDLVLKNDNPYHLYSGLIIKIHHLITLAWELSFQHVYREGNFTADWLAKQDSASTHDLQLLHHCPAALFNIFSADVMGFSSLRS
ncbi:hypothetical protein JHK87_055008 [Glycine soja]|nr:hypothetical protein JHK87_055008 [Glycine soja]